MRDDREGPSGRGSRKAAPGRGGLRAMVITSAALALLSAVQVADAQGLHSVPRERATPIPRPSVMPGPPSGSGSRVRITEIVPPVSHAMPPRPPAGWSAAPAVGGAISAAGADGCVNVFLRSSAMGGREVVSVDLHGDGLIKGAVPAELASELLARAAPPTGAGRARTVCVSPALAQSLFNPATNVAAIDPAVRVKRVADRWVLAGSREPEPVAKADAPVQFGGSRAPIQIVEPQPLPQLAAAPTTRGAGEQANPRQPPLQRAAHVIYP